MTSFFENEHEHLNIMHQNIAGLINKRNFVEIILEELAPKMEPDILCITEHFVQRGDENNIRLENFELAAIYSRNSQKRGGACILVRKGIHDKHLESVASYSVKGIFECCAIELDLNLYYYNLCI